MEKHPQKSKENQRHHKENTIELNKEIKTRRARENKGQQKEHAMSEYRKTKTKNN